MSLRRFRASAVLALSVPLATSLILTVPAAGAQNLSGALGSSDVLGSSSLPGSSELPDSPGPGAGTGNDGLYEGGVEVVEGEAENQDVITGQVFDDTNRNSALDGDEAGIEGVSVTNGVDVVITDAEGRYELPASDNMTVSVTQPAGWQVPVDGQMFAQFSYNHLPEGSPDLQFGGLEPTGPVPTAVNFPLAQSEATGAPQQSCPIATDTQTYDMEEVGWAAQGATADLMQRDDYAGCGILLLGDNVGDDLSLNDELKGLYAEANGPVRALPGNHDLDFDVADDTHSTDTYRRDFGAPYYSYDVGDTHFVALDNIIYNGADADGNGGYVEAIDQQQLEWLRNDLAQVDNNQQIVIAAHAPIIGYKEVITDNAPELYEILADYPNAVTVGGHTHTLEHHRAGDTRAEWAEQGITELTHDQIIAGAVSGDWYSGGLNDNGVPHAYTQDAAEPGIYTFEFDGTERSGYYTVRNESTDHQFLTGINSPSWREWADDAQAWQDNDKQGDAPAEIDPLTVSREDLANGESWLTTSFFGGSTDAAVTMAIDGGEAVTAEHTQPAEGEALNKGWEFTETISATHNLANSGNVAQASPHVWRAGLPETLEAGEHTAEITGTDAHGQTWTETVTFTVTE